ncbi:MAG: hypothetical protein H7Y27_03590 [Gemmatimonadaceae bacterium]|nr:hypothetical protein [Chitinophagaceae bacterium]
MNEQQQSLAALQDIKRMMERSSRFISLSGWSGVAAGICALIGAWLASNAISDFMSGIIGDSETLYTRLLYIAAGVFISALITAFLFTWLRARKNQIAIWDAAARRLMFNTAIPLVTGGLFIISLWYNDIEILIGPSCLIFYGLALVNGSKYTLGEVRYLGFGQIVLGLINLWLLDYSLQLWALGFGVLHIIYGIVMWWKYERNN